MKTCGLIIVLFFYWAICTANGVALLGPLH